MADRVPRELLDSSRRNPGAGSPSTLHGLFEQRAARQPHAAAVELGCDSLTYAELNRRANRLALRLRQSGVGPEVVVALCVERSLDAIVGVFGILKAGGAYLPLDPSYPRERLRYMVENSRAAALVTHAAAGGSGTGLLPADRVILLDPSNEPGAREDGENVESGVEPGNLAYVIYTSGSTGRPKGVEIEHGSVANHVRCAAERFGTSTGERVLQFASLGFDTSVQEIFATLIGGATLVLRPEDMLGSVSTFLARCRELRLTVLDLPTAYWHEIVAVASADGLSLPESLRLVVIGGERALPERFAQWRQLAGDRVALINAYGPTEATVAATFWEAPRDASAAERRTVPIGRPIANVETYVLDRKLRPVPIGVVGDLYVGGAGVARGYRDSPELTAERFIPDPFRHGEARLYRTGDRARFLPSGDLEYLGRLDGQIKLRGFRVEPGEIETAMRAVPGVREAVVRAHEDAPGESRLVAYVVAEPARPPSFKELRRLLKQTLPLHMVPSTFVRLDALPLTASGKLDPAALPPPGPARGEPSEDQAAPRTSIEAKLAEIWCGVMRLERVGIYDDFFDLGGHSLLAMQVVSRIRDVFHLALPVPELFSNPTVAGLASTIAARLRGQGASVALAPHLFEPPGAIPRRTDSGPAPLSSSQERLWVLDRLIPGIPLYNIPYAVRLQGRLDVRALGRAFDSVEERHEVLRSVFSQVHGDPVQTIGPERGRSLEVVDLSHVPEAAREEEVRRRAEEEARRPFDLERGPLLRTTLLRVSPEEHVLLFTFHHIVFDGWSVDVFGREVAAFYDAHRDGRSPELPPLSVQYADFSVWQRRSLEEDFFEGQLSYWRRQVQGAPAVLELPTDRPRPAVQTFRGGEETAAIPKKVADAIRTIGHREGATSFMTLLAAFQVLLLRHGGQEDMLIGSPVAGRNRSEIEGLIGFFVNTLVLRADLSGDPTFRELLARTRETAIKAYAHQDLPFEKLVEELNPERTLSHSPLVQVMMLLQDRAKPLALAGLSSSAIRVAPETAKFDLTAVFENAGDELTVSFQYSTDLFDASTIRRMLARLNVLLAAIAANPDERVSRLPLLTDRERYQLLAEWNDTAAEHPADSSNAILATEDSREKTVHRLFEEQAERTPDAVAVVFEGERVSYGELNRRANQLASFLRRRGVGPEVLVGVCLDRSLELVVAILGVLKAGGAYVPLDPEYPTDRLSFVIEDSRLEIVLTQQHLVSRFLSRAPVVCLDSDWNGVAEESGENVMSGATPASLLYVIYTSGSTGRPKGVLVTHHNVVRLLQATDPWFRFRESDVWTLFHSAAFDFSVWELWGALAYGGRLVIVPYLVSRSPNEFYELLSREKVTVLNQTPSAFRELIQAEEGRGAEMPLDLRLVIFGGEALETSSLRPWFARHGDRSPQLVNMYGITETTVHVTYRPMKAEDLLFAGSRIGRPIPDLRVYLLDRHLQPVPIGVPGEMYVGGGGVARGYLNRPELTRERFLPDPFANEPEARVYKTGDLARRLPDGDIEFLGRADQQVKIRGFRIELGEIESAIREISGVREVVVRAREDTPGDKRLVGYVVADPSAPVSFSEVRHKLMERLPAYMVPSAMVLLENLPRTPSGKLDPAALPPPEAARPELDSRYQEPRTPMEEALSGIWRTVLLLDRVGIHDNFFDLGGHSLLAMQVISRIRDVFGLALPVRELFSAPTVGGLASTMAARLGQQGASEETPTLSESPVAIPRRTDSGPAPLSSSQERLWVLDRLIGGVPLYNIPYAVRLKGRLDVEALGRAFDAVEQRHTVLRSVFAQAHGDPVQTIAPEGLRSLEIVDLSDVPEGALGVEIRRRAEEEARLPFDLERGPLLRTTLLRVSPEEHVLLFTFHHIVFDGWSVDVFGREVAAFYDAHRDGRSPELPPLSVQYADFAAWQRGSLGGDLFEGQLAYWRRQLRGAPSVLELPTDRSRPAVQTFGGGEETVTIPKPVADAIRSIGHREGATSFMTLLAAFQVLLLRHGVQEDMLIGSPVAGRNRSEIEGLIGFFVNTLVFRADLSGDPTFRELLARTRETAIEAYAHQDLPFERLVGELNPERSLSHSPLFQVMMLLQDRSEPLALSGLESSAIRVPPETAKFDLTAVFENAGDELTVSFQYSTDLFDAPTIRRMLARLNVLLAAIAADPDARVSRLPVIPQEERDLVVVQWNDTASEYPRERSIHELFEEQAAATPEAEAVLFGDRRVSYGELNERANRLARYLEKRGVGREVLVGLCVERSVDMVVGLLAILKAGGAYVPLDPLYPRPRLSFMLEDTGARLVLTQERFLEALPEGLYDCVRLDADWPAIARESGENLPSPAAAEDLAYVLYTSGSTGTPKGVSIRHRSVVRLVRGADYATFRGEVFLQFAPASFDASTFEIWGALLNGARLAVMSPGIPSLEELGEALKRHGVTTLWLTAGLFHQMVESEVASLRGVRQLLAGGDVLSVPHVKKALAELPDCRLINGYGPTESTTFACCYAVPRHEPLGASVPIGRPIANTRVYVLDRRRQPVPIGVPGELCIGGDGLARDYFRRPDLTAQKFFEDPFVAGGRLYTTGDRVRWRENGTIEFLGRIDEQIKLRGFRIEPGEIESVLAQHASVAASVVIAREDEPGDRRLVGYVVRHDGKPDPIPGLREFVASKLPDHMVPSALVFLDTLPLTANGKVDRRALPAPAASRPEGGAFVAPRTEIERTLARIWSEVLKVDRVGVHDNFFELGGHSLLATKAISRVRDSLRLEVSLRTLFQFPTIAGFAGALPARKEGAEKPIARIDRESLSRDGKTIVAAASFAQQRLWFVDQLEMGSAVYNMPHWFRIRARLDVAALERSFQEIVRRHESLRTSFASEEGRPVQVISPEVRVRLSVKDLTALPPSERDAEAARLAAEETARPFDLARDPLIRLALLSLGGADHLLVLTMHHIVSDGWSIGVFFRELSELYDAFSSGRPSALAPLPIQYADFAAWQAETIRGERLETRLSYWKAHLANLPVLDLPADRARSAARTFRGGRRTVSLPADLAEALKSLSRREGASLYMLLLAAFQILVSRHTGQEDVVVGSAVAERSRVETEKLIGLFINTLALRTDLSGDPTFRDLLGRVRRVALEAMAHELPFEMLVEALAPKRDLSRTPIFQVFFNMLNFDAADVRLAGAALDKADVGPVLSLFDLTLYAEETRGGLRFSAVYDADLFEGARISEMLNQLAGLLEQIAAAPEKRISAYSLLTASARSVLPDPTVAIPEPPMGLVTDAFLSWAERTPAAPAIVHEGRVWTYEDLARRSRALAETLIEQGLAPGEVVGVAGPRGFGLIAAMLGVLRGGGVVLTLDPALPVRRRNLMLSEARARRVLRVGSASETGSELTGPSSLPAIRLDENGNVVEGETPPPSAVLPRVDSSDPAYIFFTSGTTGVPKAVLGTHKGLTHFLDWERKALEIRPDDQCSHLTGLSFDAVMRDIFLPLTSGASLHVPDRAEDAASKEIVSWLEREGITILHAVPSLAQAWLADPPEGVRLDRLRWVVFAGEPLTDGLVRRWRSAFPGPGEIVNLYGPTETTLVKCFFVVPAEPLPGIQPVGRPLPDTQALVLREAAHPCGIGEAGEIVLRTPFASLGYLNAPREQQDRFLRNPFRADAAEGERDVLYRTGDRGRFNLDGSLSIHGRLDDQVKVRGVRIEPAEVAAVLSSHRSVRSCAVVARADSEGETALTAYVVCGDGSETASELRRHLLGRLPAAMMPAAFVFLDRLPVTPNGKLDRTALPSPETPPSRPGAGAERPERERTRTEEVLAEIWAGILGVERVGLADDFFALGGHSLTATRVMSRASRSFGLDLRVRMLFENPTLEALAAAVERKRESAAAGPGARGEAEKMRSPREEPGKPGSPRRRAATPLESRAPEISRRANPEEPAPLSFAQQRLWILDRLDPGRATYNIARAFRLRGALDVAALGRALETIQERHEVLRTVFVMEGGEPVRSVVAARPSPLSVVDLAPLAPGAREAEALRIAQEDAGRGFDLSRGPLMRATLFRLDPADQILLVNIHHIAFDGWSVGVFDQELAALYRAGRARQGPRLQELPIQYADFAVWQLDWMRGRVLEEQLSYWRRQLAGAPAVLELSANRKRPSVQTFRGAVQSLTIPGPVAKAIRSLGQREGATLFMTLLAAFQVLLLRRSGQEDILVGSPVAGRNRSEIEGLIGFFVNTLVFRTDLSGDPTFRELLARVRETSIEAYAHQDLPFERLVEELNPERSLSHSPLFQVMLLVHAGLGDSLAMDGLSISPIRLDAATSKFDLTAYFEDRGGEIEAVLQYNVDLFDAATVRRMASQLEVLFRGIAEDPDRRLSQLPLLTGRERHEVLVEWNDTAAEYPSDATIHGLFEMQAKRTPTAVAVRDGRREITFLELDRRANRLAHFLRRRGVGPETPVAVCLERSARIPEALLAILKAGGAWVPLDPSFPAERLGFMLQDSGAKVLLTESSFSPRFTGGAAEIVPLDSDLGLSSEPESAPSAGVRPDNLAYVIYTSGSTGTPKGVEAIHRAAVNRFAWMWRAYPFEPGEVCCQKTALSFVDSIWEIFGPLLQGVPIVVLPDESVRDPHLLVESLAATRVTRIVLVPSLLRALVDSGIDLASALPNLRWWITSGEALSPDLYRRFRSAMPGAAVINLYGSSEVSADVTCWDSRTGEPPDDIPIGRPIANTQIYILDNHGRPVPVGVPGEIYVGGLGLARGYRNRPDLTAERFLPDPFRREPGARLFRTGDRGRFREDGQIEYLGRTDFQVKLRGRRIEPAEIESALAAHAGVVQALVCLREDQPGQPRLVAYVIPQPGWKPAAVELRSFLRPRVADFMIPSAFVFLDALPLTASGKIDRAKLPAPEASRPELSAGFVEPRDAVEEKVARIWRETLGLEKVGVNDNFFDLGGHSLLAVSLAAKVGKEFGRNVGLTTIFRAPTVAEQARMFQEGSRSRRGAPSLVAIQPLGARPPFFLVHAIAGIVYYRSLALTLGSDQPFYGLQSQGLEGRRAPYETVEEMAAHYVREIRGFQPEGPYYIGGYSFGGKVAFEMARQLRAQGQRTAFLAILDTLNIPVTPGPTRVEHARQRTRAHLAALREAGPKGKLFYLAGRLETLRILVRGAISSGWERLYEALFHPVRRAQRRVLAANTRAARRYVPGFYEGRVTIFRATDRPDSFRDRLRTYPHLGWERLCGEGIELVEVVGGHSSLMEEEANIRALGERLEECLRAAQDAAAAVPEGSRAGS